MLSQHTGILQWFCPKNKHLSLTMNLQKHIDTYRREYYMKTGIFEVHHYDLIDNHHKDSKSNLFSCFALVRTREFLKKKGKGRNSKTTSNEISLLNFENRGLFEGIRGNIYSQFCLILKIFSCRH